MLYSPPVLSAHPVEGPSPAGDALKVGVWSPDNYHCVTLGEGVGSRRPQNCMIQDMDSPQYLRNLFSPSLSPRVLRPPDVPPACAPDLHQLHHLA